MTIEDYPSISYPFSNWGTIDPWFTNFEVERYSYAENIEISYDPIDDWYGAMGITSYGTLTRTSGNMFTVPTGYAFVCDANCMGTYQTKSGACIVVNSKAYCNIADIDITFIGTTYGLEVKSGGFCKLRGGHFKGNTRAIQTSDYASLLAEGCNFYDASGNLVNPSNVSTYKEIWVKAKGVRDIEGGWWNYNKSTGLISPLDGQTEIPDHAFEEHCIFTKLKFAPEITTIGEFAFASCWDIEEAEFPDTLTTIKRNAFGGDLRLGKVIISENTVNIGAEVFWDCRMYTAGPGPQYDIYFKWKTLPENAFYGCYFLEEVTLPDTVTEIPDCAFALCQLMQTYKIPNQITKIGQAAFAYCASLTSIEIPNGITSIGYMAFQNCTSLTTVTIPGSVKYLDEVVFYKCTALKSVILEDGVEIIDNNLFGDCEVLNNVTIPRTVKSLGKNIFINCTALKKVTYGGSQSMWTSLQNSESPSTVPTGCQIVYGMKDIKGNKYTWGYDETTGLLMPPSGVTEIPDNEFKNNLFTYSKLLISEGITRIGQQAFNGCTSLTKITIPGTVTSIGSNAFYNCTKLTSAGPIGSGCDIEFGWTTEIPAYAFLNCTSLTNITIPGTVTSIGSNAFNGCELLTSAGPIGSGCAIEFGWTDKIPRNAFGGCTDLTKVTIPGSVTSIDINVFTQCTKLTTAGPIGSGCNIEFGWDTEIPSNAFYGCSALTKVTIPNGVTTIGTNAFYNCTSLTKITIPGTVTSIGSDSNAFYNCDKLTTAGPSGSGCDYEFGWTAEIPRMAFNGCKGLTKITIPGTVTSIGIHVFSDCDKLTTAGPIGSGCDYEFGWTAEIPAYAFSRCKGLTKVTIPNGVTTIGRDAFSSCTSLTKITIPGTVTSIDFSGVFTSCSKLITAGPSGSGCNIEFGWDIEIPAYAFTNCTSLTSITIPSTITTIGVAFTNCSALTTINYEGTRKQYQTIIGVGRIPTNVTVYYVNEDLITDNSNNIWSYFKPTAVLTPPDGLTTVPNDAFKNNTQLTKVVFADTIESIGNNAFYGCSITNITIPSTITSIGNNAFTGCTSLTKITIYGTFGSIGLNLFSGCTSLTTAGPIGSGCDIEFGWTDKIPNAAFQGCSSLTDITIPSSITTIGNNAFQGCSKITSITIPNGVTSIGSNAFYNCIGLTSITIPNGVTSIGTSAFSSCISLTKIIIPSSVTSMGSSVFTNCSKLTTAGPGGLDCDIELAGWTEVPKNAFNNANMLTEIWLDDNITAIRNKGFYVCTNLKTVHLGNNVKLIEDTAFSACTNLQDINIPASMQAIKYRAFHECSDVTITYDLSSVDFKKLFDLETYTTDDYYPSTATLVFLKDSAMDLIEVATNALLEAQKPYNSSKYGAEDPHYNPDKEFQISTASIAHGTVSVSDKAKLNEVTDISVIVEKGYELDSMDITHRDGFSRSLPVKSVSEIRDEDSQEMYSGKYTFDTQMYPDNVTIAPKISKPYDWSNFSCGFMVSQIEKVQANTLNNFIDDDLFDLVIDRYYRRQSMEDLATRILSDSKHLKNITFEWKVRENPIFKFDIGPAPSGSAPDMVCFQIVDRNTDDGNNRIIMVVYTGGDYDPTLHPENYEDLGSYTRTMLIDNDVDITDQTFNIFDSEIPFDDNITYMIKYSNGNTAIDEFLNLKETSNSFFKYKADVWFDRTNGMMHLKTRNNSPIPWGTAAEEINFILFYGNTHKKINYKLILQPKNDKKPAFNLNKEITLYTGTEGTWECNLSDIEGFPTNILGDPTFSSGFFMVPMHTDMSMKVVDKKKLQLTYNIQQDAVEFSGTSKVDFPWTISNMDNYEDSKINVRVNMVTKEIVNAVISKQPTLAYDIGDPIDLTGMEMTYSYNNGSQETKVYDSTWKCYPTNGTQFSENLINKPIEIEAWQEKDSTNADGIVSKGGIRLSYTDALTVKEYMCMSTDMNPYGGESTIPKALYRKGEIVPITVKVPSGYYVDMTKLHNQGSTSSDKVITTMGYTERVEITPKNVDEYGNGTYEMIMPPCSTMINIIYTNTPPAKTYTVTLGFDDWEGGNRISVSGGGTFQEGEECSASADVRGTYFFDGWYTDSQCTPANRVSTANPYKFKVTQDITLYATYNG